MPRRLPTVLYLDLLSPIGMRFWDQLLLMMSPSLLHLTPELNGLNVPLSLVIFVTKLTVDLAGPLPQLNPSTIVCALPQTVNFKLSFLPRTLCHAVDSSHASLRGAMEVILVWLGHGLPGLE
jgi:hypothetical protein